MKKGLFGNTPSQPSTKINQGTLFQKVGKSPNLKFGNNTGTSLNSGGLFQGNSAKPGTSPLFQGNSAKPGTGIFGGEKGNPTSMFGKKNETSESMFGKKNMTSESMFGGKGNPSSMFGGQKTEGNMFAGNSESIKGGSIFGKQPQISGNQGTSQENPSPISLLNKPGDEAKKTTEIPPQNPENKPLNIGKTLNENPSFSFGGSKGMGLFGNKGGTNLFSGKQEKKENPEKTETQKPVEKSLFGNQKNLPKTFTFEKSKDLNFGNKTNDETVETKKKLTLGLTNTNTQMGKMQNETKPSESNIGKKEVPNMFNNPKLSESSKGFDLFKPKTVEASESKPETKPKLFGTKPQNPLDTLGLTKAPEASKKLFSFNAPSKPDEKKVPNFGTKTMNQVKAPGDSATFNFTGAKPKTNLFSQNTSKPSVSGQPPAKTTPAGMSNVFKSNTPGLNSNPTISGNQANPLNPGQTVKNPTAESIHLEKFNNKRVLEIQNEWETLTREVKQDIKKLGVYMNQNEEDFRRATVTIEEMKASQRYVNNEQKFLDGTLDKIISNQSNIESQLDIMDRELQSVLNQNNFSEYDQYDSDDLFAEAHVINKKMVIHERAREEFTHEINGQNSGDNLDDQFNKTINNFFESLGVVESQMQHIDRRLMSSFGMANYV